MLRARRATDLRLVSPTFVGETDEPAATDDPPTVIVERADGTTLDPPAVTAAGPAGVYVAELTADDHLDELDRLPLSRSGTVAGRSQTYELELEVVGAHYATLPEIRAEPQIADPRQYPTALVAAIRDEVETYVEDYLGYALVPRYELERLEGRGRSELLLRWPVPRALRSVSVDGTELDPADCELLEYGAVVHPGGFAGTATRARNVTVGYEHGLSVPPGPIRREVLREIRSRLAARSTVIPSQAIWQQMDGVTVRYSTPDVAAGRPTGSLQLDAVLAVYRGRAPGLA
jgi:hypothetical protein